MQIIPGVPAQIVFIQDKSLKKAENSADIYSRLQSINRYIELHQKDISGSRRLKAKLGEQARWLCDWLQQADTELNHELIKVLHQSFEFIDRLQHVSVQISESVKQQPLETLTQCLDKIPAQATIDPLIKSLLKNTTGFSTHPDIAAKIQAIHQSAIIGYATRTSDQLHAYMAYRETRDSGFPTHVDSFATNEGALLNLTHLSRVDSIAKEVIHFLASNEESAINLDAMLDAINTALYLRVYDTKTKYSQRGEQANIWQLASEEINDLLEGLADYKRVAGSNKIADLHRLRKIYLQAHDNMLARTPNAQDELSRIPPTDSLRTEINNVDINYHMPAPSYRHLAHNIDELNKLLIRDHAKLSKRQKQQIFHVIKRYGKELNQYTPHIPVDSDDINLMLSAYKLVQLTADFNHKAANELMEDCFKATSKLVGVMKRNPPSTNFANQLLSDSSGLFQRLDTNQKIILHHELSDLKHSNHTYYSDKLAQHINQYLEYSQNLTTGIIPATSIFNDASPSNHDSGVTRLISSKPNELDIEVVLDGAMTEVYKSVRDKIASHDAVSEVNPTRLLSHELQTMISRFGDAKQFIPNQNKRRQADLIANILVDVHNRLEDVPPLEPIKTESIVFTPKKAIEYPPDKSVRGRVRAYFKKHNPLHWLRKNRGSVAIVAGGVALAAGAIVATVLTGGLAIPGALVLGALIVTPTIIIGGFRSRKANTERNINSKLKQVEELARKQKSSEHTAKQHGQQIIAQLIELMSHRIASYPELESTLKALSPHNNINETLKMLRPHNERFGKVASQVYQLAMMIESDTNSADDSVKFDPEHPLALFSADEVKRFLEMFNEAALETLRNRESDLNALDEKIKTHRDNIHENIVGSLGINLAQLNQTTDIDALFAAYQQFERLDYQQMDTMRDNAQRVISAAEAIEQLTGVPILSAAPEENEEHYLMFLAQSSKSHIHDVRRNIMGDEVKQAQDFLTYHQRMSSFPKKLRDLKSQAQRDDNLPQLNQITDLQHRIFDNRLSINRDMINALRDVEATQYPSFLERQLIPYLNQHRLITGRWDQDLNQFSLDNIARIERVLITQRAEIIGQKMNLDNEPQTAKDVLVRAINHEDILGLKVDEEVVESAYQSLIDAELQQCRNFLNNLNEMHAKSRNTLGQSVSKEIKEKVSTYISRNIIPYLQKNQLDTIDVEDISAIKRGLMKQIVHLKMQGYTPGAIVDSDAGLSLVREQLMQYKDAYISQSKHEQLKPFLYEYGLLTSTIDFSQPRRVLDLLDDAIGFLSIPSQASLTVTNELTEPLAEQLEHEVEALHHALAQIDRNLEPSVIESQLDPLDTQYIQLAKRLHAMASSEEISLQDAERINSKLVSANQMIEEMLEKPLQEAPSLLQQLEQLMTKVTSFSLDSIPEEAQLKQQLMALDTQRQSITSQLKTSDNTTDREAIVALDLAIADTLAEVVTQHYTQLYDALDIPLFEDGQSAKDIADIAKGHKKLVLDIIKSISSYDLGSHQALNHLQNDFAKLYQRFNMIEQIANTLQTFEENKLPEKQYYQEELNHIRVVLNRHGKSHDPITVLNHIHEKLKLKLDEALQSKRQPQEVAPLAQSEFEKGLDELESALKEINKKA